MDVRCEKCQTEYELDEARLKPGGVTVKCTNCGHMFKIRKRTITNVGTPAVRDANETTRLRGTPPPVARPRADSIFEDDGKGDEAPTTIERQWLLRLENGEQKSCRELATLQQWIISNVVTRESLISRTGKTWKRLGDIPDLGQYFTIADEARASRDRSKPVARPPAPPPSSTLPGYGGAAQAAGGTILPDDDELEPPTTRNPKRVAAVTPPPVPTRGVARTPPMGSNAATSVTEPVFAPPPRRSSTTPPPPPPRRSPTTPPPLPKRPVLPTGPSGPTAGAHPPAIPQGSRATAAWATDNLTGPSGAAQSGPFVGKLSAAPDEPAFAGRVRMSPGDESTFETGKVRAVDDRDDVLPANRGSRAGMWVLVMALLVMGAGAAAVYVFVIRTGRQPVAQPVVKDAGVVAVATPDATAVVVSPPGDAAAEVASALDAARGELAADVEPRLRTALLSLDGKPDAPAQALRAQLIAQLAQDLQDRASVTADKPLADTLRKEAKQLVLDAATAAQRALKAAGDDAGANLAMASVLRLQGKPARDIKRYLDMARAKPDKDWARDLALADGLVLARDNKLDDAKAAFSALDQGDGKLETTGDVRARLHLALVLAAQNKAADAKPLVEAILAAQPEHATAKALATKLETLVAQTDPLPPEDGKPAVPHPAPRDAGVAHDPTPRPTRDAAPPVEASGGDQSYERLLKRANTIADSSCTQAMELYAKALEQKPNGIEALTGMGYCHIDAKQFASAFSKFRAALAVSSRYEPALRGVAEAYQQQGRKEQAIEAYKAYLEIYPDSAAAKKQLERLGGGDSPAPTPTPPAPTPPAPTPAEPSGAGSGSE